MKTIAAKSLNVRLGGRAVVADFTAEEFIDSIEAAGHGGKS